MRTLRSNLEPGTTAWAVRRAQWCALGLDEEMMQRPKIAVVNTSSELSICFSHLDGLVTSVKEAIRQAGGLPFEIRTVAPSDFITGAGRSGRYLMPARDLVVNDIEVAVEGAQLDGMVLLSSCDKTTPAHLMAAGRLDLPSVVLACGYQGHGSWRESPTDIEDVFESVGGLATGESSLKDIRSMCDVAICGPGVCPGMGTANTMQMAAEVLGMALPGNTPISAESSTLIDRATDVGRRIVELVHSGVSPRTILTQAAFRHAVAVSLAVGGSVNLVRHLQAVAVEAELAVNVYDLVDELGSMVPLLCPVKPNGPVRIAELDRAGGTLGVLRQIRPLLDESVVGVSGLTLGELLDDAAVDESVIRRIEAPAAPGPSLVVMRGNLAPGGSLLKLGASGEQSVFEGPAMTFESQELALEALHKSSITAGTVAVLRGLGPVGGPGVASASWFVAALNGSSLAGKVAVITDGQLSGLNHGLAVGQVSPEAADGGPLGLVIDGDMVRIDPSTRRTDLQVDADELARRVGNYGSEHRAEHGWLGMYRELVEPLHRGAVLRRAEPPTGND